MKITGVKADNRRRVFHVSTRQGELSFPYAKADPPPSASDRLLWVVVDPELGREAFTYRLASGREGSVHIDSVLEYNEDPTYMAELLMYQLTTEAKKRFEESGLSVRVVSQRLGTSPTQLYRLLEPTNYSKSLRQLLAVLYLFGYEVDMRVRPRPRPTRHRNKPKAA